MLNDRQNIILNLLQDSEQLSVDDLAERFAVSTQTIRKDINQLCEQGLARRLHGGISLPATTRNISYHSRQTIRSASKQHMAERLADKIPEGASLFLGIGTSVALFAKALCHHKRIRILTNNLDVANILCDQPETEVIVAGGTLRHNDRDLVGESVTRFIEQFRVDFGVIGSGGLSPEHGLLDFDPSEADVSRAILNNARQRVLLADSTKWSRKPMVKVAPFNQIDLFVTDLLPDHSLADTLSDQGVKLITTENH